MSPLLATTITIVRAGIDLTDRQKALLGVVVEEPDADHTVRGLAARFGVSKPAITRCADKLVDCDFLKRTQDSKDRRSVLMTARAKGQKQWRAMVEALEKAIGAAAAE